MVAKKAIKKSDIEHLFDIRSLAIEFIEQKGYELRKMTKIQLIAQLDIDVPIYRAEKQARHQELQAEDEVKEKIYMGCLLPNIKKKDGATRASLYKQLTALLDIENNDYGVKFVQINTDAMFTVEQAIIMTSDEIREFKNTLERSDLTSQLVKSLEEETRHKEKVRRLAISKNIPPESIKWEIYNIMKKDDIGLVYTVNGQIKDITQYVLNICSEEAQTTELFDKNGLVLNCFIKCVLSQVNKYLKTRRKNELISMNKPDITLADMDIIAKTLSLKITVIDCEAVVWKIFDYTDGILFNTQSVYVVVYGGHTYNLKREYRLHLSNKGSSIIVERGDSHITHIDETTESYKITTCIINEQVHIRTLQGELGLIYQIVELSMVLDSNYVCFMDGNLESVLELLISQGIYPVILSHKLGIICLKIKIGKYFIQIRGDKHTMIEYAPYNFNYTPGSTAMYLFRRHLQSSLLKVADPVIARVFKQMCSPCIYMKPCNLTQYTYLIDINRAYKSHLKKIGVFDRQPMFKLKPDKIRSGVYEVNGEFITGETARFRKILPGTVRYYCEFNQHTDTIHDWSETIYADDELSDKDKKNTVNLLIGKLNPNIDEMKHYATFSNKYDMDMFVGKTDKKILHIKEVNRAYIVEYMYITDDKYMEASNASYISAQVICRTKLQVEKKMRELESQGCQIWGTMTDSILFTSTKKLDFTSNDKIGEWDLCAEGNKLIVRGVGQYAILNNDIPVYQRALGGVDVTKDESKILTHPTKVKKSLIKDLHSVCKGLPLQSNTLIIGKAGIGKSTYIRNNYSRGKFLRTAFTGLASHQIGGKTISSIFKLGHINQNSVEVAIGKISRKTRNRLMVIDGIIFDEYYTLPYSIMYKVNEILKFIRRSSQPFGGLDLILVGDDRQTSAVGKAFVDSSMFKKLVFTRKVLPEHPLMRLKPKYMKFCDALRNGKIRSTSIIELITDKRLSQTEVSGRIVYYKNKDVDERNLKELNDSTEDVIYIQREKIPFEYGKDEITPPEFVLESQGPVLAGDKQYGYVLGDNIYSYKRNTPIYITSNKNGLFSGMVGTLEDYKKENDKGSFKIRTSEQLIEAIPEHNINFIPAYSMTIHKAQCKTFTGINIYMKKELILARRDICIRLLYTAMTRVRDFSQCYINID
jgi:hypothetical protein